MQSPFAVGIEGRIDVRGICHDLVESVLVAEAPMGIADLVHPQSSPESAEFPSLT